jgi:nitrogenase molybdenum-iron protein alpha chain
MNARQPLEKLHRQTVDYPPLAPAGQRISLPAWNYAWNRVQMGRLATGGCLYGGQTANFWAPLRDLLHVTNGPVGCGVYAQANRPQVAEGYSSLNLTTDFQEKDVVFGGDNKLARSIAEANQLFPLHRGITLLSTCPVALIGDDINAVARQQAKALGKPVVPVHCAGFRRADGIGDTHATIAGTWRDWAEPSAEPPGPRDVTLLCREMNGAWQGIVRLLEEIGLRVTARWPAGGSRAETGRLGKGRLCISIGMDYWAKRLQQQYGLPWVEADFLGAGATRESLRAIAAHFDAEVGRRAEAIIAAHAPAAEALVAETAARVAGRLYFSFLPLLPREIRVYNEFGIRAGSALQGWPDQEGRWQVPEPPRRHQEMTHAQMEALLRRVQPDLVDGLGQDSAALKKMGYAVLDDSSRAELASAASGFEGVERLARAFLPLFASPLPRLLQAPWKISR